MRAPIQSKVPNFSFYPHHTPQRLSLSPVISLSLPVGPCSFRSAICGVRSPWRRLRAPWSATQPWRQLAAAGYWSDDGGRRCAATARVAQLVARCDPQHPHGALLREAVGGAPQENHHPVPWAHGSHPSVAWDSVWPCNLSALILSHYL
ncbi:hypothetical protein BS78_01G158700 [Paspalum vaginatum]|nr:hypothetical protein BS78_01G158700 [Paspalum vaginatum]